MSGATSSSAIPTARYHRRSGPGITLLVLALVLAAVALTLSPAGPVEPALDAFGAMLHGAIVLVMLAAMLAALLRTGLVDLSTGAVFGLAVTVIRVLESHQGLPFWEAALAALAVALLAGALNAWLTVRLGLASVIATLTTALLAAGLAAALAHGFERELAAMTRSPMDPVAALLGGTVSGLVPAATTWPPPLDMLAAVPMGLLWTLVLVLLLAWAAGVGKAGWHATAVGSGPETARRLGLSVGRIRARALLLTGLAAGLAAALAGGATAATLPSPPLAMLTGLEALAAAAIGSALAVGIGAAVLAGAAAALAFAIGSAALAQHGIPFEVGPLVAGGGALLLLFVAGEARRSLLGGFA